MTILTMPRSSWSTATCTSRDQVEIHLLGGFDVTIGGSSVVMPFVCRRLLACLALTGRPHQRSFFARRLWPDDTEQRAAANLRSTLWRIRRIAAPLVESVGTRLVLAAVRLDMAETVRALHEGVEGGLSTVRLGRLPVTAELLPDWPDEWVDTERKGYRQFRLHALESISSRLISEQRYGSAIDFALAAMAIEPLRASARRLLIQTYLAEGNRSEAVREFNHYTSLLRRRLGMEPPADLTSLLHAGLTD